MIQNKEFLEEGWVKFTRFHCKSGYIDRWLGDCIDNPNNFKQSTVCLNSIAQYFRLNSGTWISDRELGRSRIFPLLDERDQFTAEEIWNKLKDEQ